MRTFAVIVALAFAAGCNKPAVSTPTPAPAKTVPVAVAPAPTPAPPKQPLEPFACPGPFSDCADVVAGSSKAASAPVVAPKGKATPAKMKTGKTG